MIMRSERAPMRAGSATMMMTTRSSRPDFVSVLGRAKDCPENRDSGREVISERIFSGEKKRRTFFGRVFPRELLGCNERVDEVRSPR
jgi:hypothetical protein